jgi:hypothetical protein
MRSLSLRLQLHFYRIKMGRIENAESGGKWLQSIIFHYRLIVGIGTDGRTQISNYRVIIPMSRQEITGNLRNAERSITMPIATPRDKPHYY